MEISVETHDDEVRAAFGKNHYTMEQVEESIRAALRHGCKRFDLYFMTGIPTQTAESIRETGPYVEHLYEVTGNDPRLLAFSSPMAPFLDPGSMAFDNPERFGYKRRATTLEEHRRLLVQPSWKYIMNYESDCLSADDLVDAQYEVGIQINRTKARLGMVPQDVALETERRIHDARVAMARIDDAMERPAGAARAEALLLLKSEMELLSESTVCEKRQLNWPHKASWRHVVAVIGLWIRETLAHLFGRRHAAPRSVPATPEV